MSRSISGLPKQKTSHIWRKAKTIRAFVLRSSSRRHTQLFSSQTAKINTNAWMQFLRHYENFTDVLCAAAKNGCDDALEAEYMLVRHWFASQYHRVSSHLKPYVRSLSTEAWNIRRRDGGKEYTTRQNGDVLESLFRTRTLREILEGDKGGLIDRVSLLTDAVYLCDRELS